MKSFNTQQLRIGVVNFLNATPLIEGISSIEGVEIIPRVPSALLGCLERGEVDIALASSIDYQRSSVALGILPVGVLSSNGPSRTVQLCSRLNFRNVTKVHCDTDSHTSIVLLQIILDELYGIQPEIISTDFRTLECCSSKWPDTVLLIGDKVVTNSCESEYENTLDLGSAWNDQTTLPFVFATWFGRINMAKEHIQKATMLLSRQLKCNQQRIEQIVSMSSSVSGWQPEEALQYVTDNMKYTFEDTHLESLAVFYALAKSHGLIEKERVITLLEP